MISAAISKLIKDASVDNRSEGSGQDGTMFEINRIISKTASYYEKVRYSLDYKEDHTIRRSAIERMLKRKLLIEGQEAPGQSLLQELVSGQYIGESYLNDSTGKALDHIISRFLLLYAHTEKGSNLKKKLISFAASEIDFYLDSYAYHIDTAVLEAFYTRVRPYVSVDDGSVSGEELDMALYCGCARSLLGSDDDMLSYALWRKFVPTWEVMSEAEIRALAEKLGEVAAKIQRLVGSPFQWQVVRRIKNETVYFLIIRQLVRQYGKEAGSVLEDSSRLDDYVKTFLEHIYKKENERIKLRGIRAIIYILCTKIILALLIELPYEVAVFGGIQLVPLTVNIAFPPVLLFLLTRGVRKLDAKNTAVVIGGVHTIVYGDTLRKIKLGKPSHSGITAVFFVLYAVFVGAVLGSVIVLLQILNFNVVSMMLFLFFLTLVSYFAFRIRYNAKRWQVVNQDSFMGMLGSIMALPIINTGRWLSQKFSSINVLVLILDFIVETPFKFALNFSNGFITYLKSKAEELR